MPPSQSSAPPPSDPSSSGASPSSPDICIVLNPGSGRKRRGVRDEIEAAIARHPGRFELRVVRKGREIPAQAERAATDGFATLVAAGGDGTIGAVAAAAHRHGRTLGVLSMGTFNFFARGLDLPEGIAEGIDLIAAGPTRAIDIGEVNGEVFLNNASLGLYPAILAQREGIYKRWGRSRIAAHWSVLVTFTRFHKPLSLDVTIDGRRITRRTPLAFVAHSAYQLDLFGLTGADDVRAGRLALFLAPDQGRLALLMFALRLFRKSTKRGRDFDYYSGETIDIETRRKHRLLARDGEREKMRSPFRFRVLHGGLTVIAPEAIP